MEKITQEKLELIQDFLRIHPSFIAAYGYGSGVVSQCKNNSFEKKDIDLIVIVNNLLEYFHKNMDMNPNEFTNSSRKYFQKATVEKLEKGAPIVYIPHIQYQEHYFKTGIISKESLLSSCYDRTSSYVPFRLEKPCVEISCSDEEIHKAILYDRQVTLLLCLLLLKEDEKTMRDLITKICSISYLGDFRVKIKCEDPNKIRNLVDNQFDYFVEDYNAVNKGYYNIENGILSVNYDAINRDLGIIPEPIKKVLNVDYVDKKDLLTLSKKLIEYYKKESERECLRQTIKGIQSSGLEKSIAYGLKKVQKGRIKKNY